MLEGQGVGGGRLGERKQQEKMPDTGLEKLHKLKPEIHVGAKTGTCGPVLLTSKTGTCGPA